jgi:hypothetical protein
MTYVVNWLLLQLDTVLAKTIENREGKGRHQETAFKIIKG